MPNLDSVNHCTSDFLTGTMVDHFTSDFLTGTIADHCTVRKKPLCVVFTTPVCHDPGHDNICHESEGDPEDKTMGQNHV